MPHFWTSKLRQPEAQRALVVHAKLHGTIVHAAEEFAGRGDMSRGALLLRAVASNLELRYTAVPPVKAKLNRSRGPKSQAKSQTG